MKNTQQKFIRTCLVPGLIAAALIMLPFLWVNAQTTATMYTDGTNFGIGTTGPTQKLQIVGTVSASSFTGDGSGLTGISAGGWTDGGTNVYTSTTTDNVGIGTTTPTAALLVENEGTQDSFRVNDAVLDGTPFVVSAVGNIGVATTTPRSAVDVSGTNQSGKIFVGNNASTGSGRVTNPGTSVEHSQSIAGMINAVMPGSDTTAPYHAGLYAGTGGIHFYALLALRMGGSFYGNTYGALSDGDVLPGIGFAGQADTGDPNGMVLGASVQGVVDGTVSAGVLPTSMVIRTSATSASGLTERLRVTSSGNVGIGTAKPVSRFVVNGGVGIGTLLNSAFIQTAAPSGGLIVENNVGIGTHSPAAALNLFTSSNPESLARLTTGSSAVNHLHLENAGTNGGNWFLGTSNDNYSVGGAGRFYISPSSTTSFSRFTVLQGGNIGIGTNDPLGALTVMNGNVGIGTWSPTSIFQVGTTMMVLDDVSFRASLIGGAASGYKSFAVGDTAISSGTFAVAFGHEVTSAAFKQFTAGTDNLLTGSEDASNWVTTDPIFVVGNGTAWNARSNALMIFKDGRSLFSGGTTVAAPTSTAAMTVMGTTANNAAAAFNATDSSGNSRFAVINDGNVGVGTYAPRGRLIVTGGNVGVGTLDPVGALAVMNGNVGIGTWSPTQRLQVVGTVSATSFVGDGSGLTGISAGGWTDGGTNVFTSATTDNVGMGTTTPSTTLEIVQQSGRSPLMVSSTPTGDGDYMIMLSDGRFGIGTTAPGDRSEFVNSQDNISFFSFANYNSGSLSSSAIQAKSDVARGYISAASSTYTYQHLAGRAGFGAGLTTLGIDIFNSNTSGDIHFISGDPSLATSIRMGIEATGNIGIGTYSSPNQLTVTGAVGIGTTLPYRMISAPNNGLAVAGNVGIGTWAANSGRLIVMGGNVGIGTVAPGGVLDVGTVAGIPIVSDLPTYQVGIHQQSGVASDETLILTNGGGILRPSSIQFRGSSALNSNVFSSGRIVSGASGTGYSSSYLTLASSSGNNSFNNEMTLTNGNVGIGTSAPVAGLAVMNGNVGIGTWSPTQRLQVVGTVSATSFVGDGSGLTGISAGGWTDGGTNVYTSTTTDNVGIGTTAPGTTLEVSSADATAVTIFRNTNASGYANTQYVNNSGNIIYVGIGGSSVADYPNQAYVFSNGAVPIHFANSSTTRMTITAGGAVGIGTTLSTDGLAVLNGNVGIGTWSAGSRLMIRGGNVGIGTTTQYLRIAAPANGMAIEGNVGIGTWAAASGKLIVMGGNVGVGTITPVGAFTVMNGNVGIGTWSPVNRLQVKGSFTTGAVTLADAATIATDASLGNLFRVTLGGNRTLGNPTNGVDGQRVTWELIQDGSGSRTISLDTKFALGSDISSVTLTTTATKRDFLGAVYNATEDKWYVVSFVKGY